jgi:hypothetical protein
MKFATDSNRVTGAILTATAIASIALLLNHPAEQATDFAGLLKDEAANRVADAVVHGGFILLLAIQLACYAVFAGYVGWARALAVGALAFFALGAITQMASLFVDGLMLPALAAKYVAAPPDRLPLVRSLFVLCGDALQFLMPLGLLFQSVAVALWGGALLNGWRLSGIAGLALGILTAIALVAALVTGMQHFLMMAIVGLALWALTAGLTMARQPSL